MQIVKKWLKNNRYYRLRNFYFQNRYLQHFRVDFIRTIFYNIILKSISYKIITPKRNHKMCKKIVSQASLFDQAIHQLISLIKPEKAPMNMNQVLDENPDILTTVYTVLSDRKNNTAPKRISIETGLSINKGRYHRNAM